MNFPESHPLWMWLYFGSFGSIGLILVSLIVWSWMNFLRVSDGHQRAAAKWSMIGYMFLFFSAWFACGIGGSPGNLLSPDPDSHYLAGATYAAVLAMFFSVPGWLCVLVGQRKMLKGVQSEMDA